MYSLASPIRLALNNTEISRQNLLSQYVMSIQVTNKFAGVEAWAPRIVNVGTSWK